MAFTGTFTLDEETIDMLNRLSIELATTKSELLRIIIRKTYEAQFSKPEEQPQPVEG